MPLCGAEELDVEHRHQALTGGPAVTLVNIDGALVCRSDGTWCLLQQEAGVDDPSTEGEREKIRGEQASDGSKSARRTGNSQGHSRERRWFPAGGLPDDAVIVVRTAALDALKARVSESSSTAAESKPTATDKPLTTRERNSLLIIIGALAKMAKVDIGAPSSAAESIQCEAELSGLKIGKRTVEEHLKKVEETMERRI